MANKTNATASIDPQLKDLIEESKAQARAMGIVKPCDPIDSFLPSDAKRDFEEYQDIFGNFVHIDNKPARRIYPSVVIPMANHNVREKTEEERKKFIYLHEYVECYLHSNVALFEQGTFSDLVFAYNPTRWSNFEVWNISHGEKIEVPRHIILHINKTCTPYELVSRELSPEEISRNLYQTSYSEGGKYYMKKAQRPQFYFTASSAPVRNIA